MSRVTGDFVSILGFAGMAIGSAIMAGMHRDERTGFVHYTRNRAEVIADARAVAHTWLALDDQEWISDPVHPAHQLIQTMAARAFPRFVSYARAEKSTLESVISGTREWDAAAHNALVTLAVCAQLEGMTQRRYASGSLENLLCERYTTAAHRDTPDALYHECCAAHNAMARNGGAPPLLGLHLPPVYVNIPVFTYTVARAKCGLATPVPSGWYLSLYEQWYTVMLTFPLLEAAARTAPANPDPAAHAHAAGTTHENAVATTMHAYVFVGP